MTEIGARVVIVDPDDVVRAGLDAILSKLTLVRVVGCVGTSSEAIEACQAQQPDVVLIDAFSHDRPDCALIAELRQASPRTAVVVFTRQDDPALVLEAIGAGARAFVLKGSSAELLATAIDRVVAGETYVEPVLAGRVIGAASSAASRSGLIPKPDPLTGRERDVLREVARGRSNKEIAGTLDVASGTVKAHVEHILRKLVASNRAEATTRGWELGILELEEEAASIAPARGGPS